MLNKIKGNTYPKEILTLLAYAKSPFKNVVRQAIQDATEEEHWQTKKSAMKERGFVYNGVAWVADNNE